MTTNYILIDAQSGYIFGHAVAATPALACATIDADLLGDPREYETRSVAPRTTCGGYDVYCAPADYVLDGNDGTNQLEIDRVTENFQYAAHVIWTAK